MAGRQVGEHVEAWLSWQHSKAVHMQMISSAQACKPSTTLTDWQQLRPQVGEGVGDGLGQVVEDCSSGQAGRGTVSQVDGRTL